MNNGSFQEKSKKSEQYYIGLDIGTDSVGYAVTDKDYSLCKYKAEPMWGVMLFDNEDEKETLLASRRGFRVSRRRIRRRHQRIQLIRELFAREIYKVDPEFYIRLDKSALWADDKEKYTDVYHDNDHKTIHHLIVDLMESAEDCDIRQLYSACAWLVSHRGHFLLEADGDAPNIFTDITSSYEEFETWFFDNGYPLPWKADPEDIKSILSDRETGVKKKEEKLKECLGINKSNDLLMQTNDEEQYDGTRSSISRLLLIKLFAGGKVDLKKTFTDIELEKAEVYLSSPDDIEEYLPVMGNYGDLVRIMEKIYDSASLSKMLKGKAYISQTKVEEYDTHQNDANELKYLLKKYGTGTGADSTYSKMFRVGKDIKGCEHNYSAYVANFDSYSDDKKQDAKRASREDFYKYVEATLKGLKNVTEEDQKLIVGIRDRISRNAYMPKQVNSDNRLIPQQLYYAELKQILENAEKVFPFLTEKDEYGTVVEKILSVFKFKIPYYVGPLYKDEKLQDHNKFAWIERKAEGKIYPWNFDDMVDLEKSEDEFIRKMTNKCTYLPWKYVLPKNSLLYCKYEVLNEINNIRIDKVPLSVEKKQRLYNEVFMKNAKVTFKKVDDFLYSNLGCKRSSISGIDKTIKSSLKPYIDFAPWLESGALTESNVEEIINRITCTTDTKRLKQWLRDHFELCEEDVNKISSFKYSEFGRLSRELLNGMEGTDQAGEIGTVLYFMWNTNDNLMQIIESDRYDFKKKIKGSVYDYYSEHPKDINQKMDDMRLPAGVRKSVMRTFDVLEDVIKTKGAYPEKIFVEMTRSKGEKGDVKESRKDQLEEVLRAVEKNESYRADVDNILKTIEKWDNRKLQSEKYYLYTVQLGRCMYCGKKIEIEDLANGDMYNIDHIWPQAYIKDDSIHNNKVLVHSHENGSKTDIYPIPAQYRQNDLWEHLHKYKLINDIKYDRLKRNTEFTDDEKQGFINRQINVTSQATKAVASLLEEKYPQTDIVYVKANNVSNFRHDYGEIVYQTKKEKLTNEEHNAFTKKYELVKSRTANDAHHAHDAYLNIVVGNMYHEMITKKFYLKNYDLRNWTKVVNIFSKERRTQDKELIWDPAKHIANVNKAMATKQVHLVKYQYKKKGELFNQTRYKKNADLVPLKTGSDPAKYGGYNSASVAYYVLVKYKKGKKNEMTLLPVTVLDMKKFEEDEIFAKEYISKETGTNVFELVLGKFPIRINTIFSLDGLEVCISGKTNNNVLVRSLITPYYSDEQIKYIKKIENVDRKAAMNKDYIPDEEHDGITCSENISLYDCIVGKIRKAPFTAMPGGDAVEDRNIFIHSSANEQWKVLKNMILYFKTNRSGGCNVRRMDEKGNLEEKKSGILVLSANMSNWTKSYHDVRIIHRSPAGLHEKRSENLLEILARDGQKQ